MSEIRSAISHKLQDELVLKLKSDAELANIDIFTEKTKDIETEIDNSLGSLKGICMIVITPRLKASKPNVPGPMFDNTTVVVRVIENVMINQDSGTKMPCLFVAELIATRLHHFTRTDGQACYVDEIVLVPDETNLIYDVICKTIIGLRQRSTT